MSGQIPLWCAQLPLVSYLARGYIRKRRINGALHALHKSPFSFPCQQTVVKHHQDFKLRVTVGDVKISDIHHNIEVMFKDVPPSHLRVGITLMMDEIATDGRMCYLSDTDECGGLCEHAAEKFTSMKLGNNLEVIHAIAAAVRAGEVHIGQEVFVAAFARNDTFDYSAKPVLVFPTCKSGTAQTSALIIEKLRQAWQLSPYGEKLHGPIWSIASDGDPKRRPALYLQCMAPDIEAGICKLLCTREGILVNKTVINKDLLWQWLEQLEGVDWTDDTLFSLLNPKATTTQNLDSLLNPKDPQDVPRAIKLLVMVSELRNLSTARFDPTELETHRALSLLGEMLNALVEPFINPSFTITQQIKSLVRYSFLSCALYIKHEHSFMPSHLYSDLQSMVKTAVFRVTQTLILDPDLAVLLCLLGDNSLEILFGRSRMIGGHKPNFAVDEIGHRFSSCVCLSKLYLKYLHWERKPRRLKLVRNRDFDHLTPRCWKPSAIAASSCDISICWSHGTTEAEEILERLGLPMKFSIYFRDWKKRNINLMRPIEGKRYPGISAEVDRSLDDLVASQSAPVQDLDLQGYHEFRLYQGKEELDKELAVIMAALKAGYLVWIDLGERMVHKKTIICLFSDPTLDLNYNKSHDRLIRVRCFSIGGDKRNRTSGPIIRELPADSIFKLDDLFATLVAQEVPDPTSPSICELVDASAKEEVQLQGGEGYEEF
ncbi:hypothetical protein EST38_g10936 [Candolleomyces aberdarensis]|uniref:Uncharacterized protein n=1 Tax=Candolleomyces aberdarensis TaxID=2316362 RepID=A0A4Q2D8F1_9AGAR|nr:hypothetical protein EST38_g10936 [Candolleomyces aberdarensis]